MQNVRSHAATAAAGDSDTVKADIQQVKQDIRAAEDTGDKITLAFQRRQLERLQKQLEQLGEEKLVLLQAQTAGQLGLLLPLIMSLHRFTMTL